MAGTTVDFPSNGHTCGGYLAVPASGSGPGAVVIQEWWGLVPHIRDVCDRLAAEGFTALAPDLYHGDAAGLDEPDAAGKLMMGMRLDDAVRDMSGAVTWLLQSEHATGERVGVVGFCMGGGLALILATRRPEIAACVPFYPVMPWPDAAPDFAAARAKVVAHFGTADHSNPPEAVDALEAKLRAAGVDVEVCRYEADHAFFNSERPPVYSAADAGLAWDRTLALFRAQLTGV